MFEGGDNLRAKRFRAVSEKRTRNETGRKMALVDIFLSAKTENAAPWSFFAPKPDGHACYAGLEDKGIHCSFLCFPLSSRIV